MAVSNPHGMVEDERKRQHISNKTDEVFHRHVVVHQQRKKFAKYVFRRREPRLSTAMAKCDVDQQLATNKSVRSVSYRSGNPKEVLPAQVNTD